MPQQYLELDQSDAYTVPADDEGGRFPSTRFDLHGASDGLPHLGLAGGDVCKEQESGLKPSSAFIQQILTFIYKRKVHNAETQVHFNKHLAV